MKKVIVLFQICFFIFFTVNLSCQIVSIPDANFKACLLSNDNINTNGDDEIQVSEAEAFDGMMACVSKDINSLIGIEAFIELDDLRCLNNNLTQLDLSKNLKLRRLSCFTNNISELDISMLVNLESINAHTNGLTAIDVTNNSLLKEIYLQNNYITSLELTNVPQLQKLVVYNNLLTSIDVSLIPNVIQINLSTNPISTIDVSNNNLLSTFKIANTDISELELSNNFNLTNLDCSGNEILNLDFSNNLNIRDLFCSNNLLESINLDSSNQIRTLLLDTNKLTELDFGHLEYLLELQVNDNSLTQLNIATGNNSEMTYVNSSNNPDLLCIGVDDVDFALASDWIKDESSNYSLDCSTFTAILPNDFIQDVTLSPNPVKDQLLIHHPDLLIQSFKVFNSQGQLQKVKEISAEYIDVSLLDSGLYSIVISFDQGQFSINRFVKL